MVDEEYEIIAASPMRRLEKRLERLETGTGASETKRLIEQIIELIKSNQRVIDDVIKANAELRNELSRIPGKIDDLLNDMKEFMDLLKASATEETVTEISKDVMNPVVNKMSQLVDQNKKLLEVNQAALASLGTIDTRMKRLYIKMATGR